MDDLGKTTTIRLSGELAAGLDDASRRLGIPLNSLLAIAGNEWLERHHPDWAVGPWQVQAAQERDLPAAPRTTFFERGRFQDDAWESLVQARREAEQRGHHWLGTEHVLLGLEHVPESRGTVALIGLGFDFGLARNRLDDVLGQGWATRLVKGLPTTRVKKILQLAARQAEPGLIGTEHMLIGLLLEEKGLAARLLLEQGVTLAKAREALDL